MLEDYFIEITELEFNTRLTNSDRMPVEMRHEAIHHLRETFKIADHWKYEQVKFCSSNRYDLLIFEVEDEYFFSELTPKKYHQEIQAYYYKKPSWFKIDQADGIEKFIEEHIVESCSEEEDEAFAFNENDNRTKESLSRCYMVAESIDFYLEIRDVVIPNDMLRVFNDDLSNPYQVKKKELIKDINKPIRQNVYSFKNIEKNIAADFLEEGKSLLIVVTNRFQQINACKNPFLNKASINYLKHYYKVNQFLSRKYNRKFKTMIWEVRKDGGDFKLITSGIIVR